MEQWSVAFPEYSTVTSEGIVINKASHGKYLLGDFFLFQVNYLLLEVTLNHKITVIVLKKSIYVLVSNSLSSSFPNSEGKIKN